MLSSVQCRLTEITASQLEELAKRGVKTAEAVRRGVALVHAQEFGSVVAAPISPLDPSPKLRRPPGRPPKVSPLAQDGPEATNDYGFVFDYPDDQLMGFLRLSGACVDGMPDPEGTETFVSFSLARRAGVRELVIEKHSTAEKALAGGSGFASSIISMEVAQSLLSRHLKKAPAELLHRLQNYVSSLNNS